jgi:hypothetical protein
LDIYCPCYAVDHGHFQRLRCLWQKLVSLLEYRAEVEGEDLGRKQCAC